LTLEDDSLSRSFLRLVGWSGRRGSIRTQLIVWNIVALALLLGLLGLVTHFVVRTFIINGIRQQLEEHIQAFQDHMPPFGPPGGRDGGGPRFHNPDGPHDAGPPQAERQDDLAGLYDLMEDAGEEQGPDDMAQVSAPGAGLARRGGNTSFFRPDRGRHPGGPPNGGPDKLYIYDLDGQPQGESTHALADRPAFDLAKDGQERDDTMLVDSEISYVVTRPIRDHDHKIKFVAQAFRSLVEVYDVIENLDRALLALIPVGLIGAGMAGAYLTDRVLRRVRGLTEVAGLIGARNLSDRLPVTGNDEFSELAGTFNGLLGRLEAAFAEQQRALEQQRRFTADASHELKTPLTIIKGNTSMALEVPTASTGYRQTLQDIDRAADTMSSLVQDLLLLARSDGGQLGRDPIELLVRELLERAASAVAHHKGALIALQIEDDALCVPGNEGELVRLFTNLLDNATRYTPPGGRITVRAARQGGRVVIAVADTGPGIAPEHLPHLGERFYRVDSSRSRPAGGTGLGLSICKSIVEAHSGTLSFQSTLGVGTTVTVTLPAVAAP
jgi:signal transduction histidine kinase